MDKRKEKYYNYIVDDLFKKVHVVSTPFGINDISVDGIEIDYRGFASSTVFTIYHKWVNDLIEHLIEKYGVNDDESELNTIWFRLRNKVREELLRPSDDGELWIND